MTKPPPAMLTGATWSYGSVHPGNAGLGHALEVVTELDGVTVVVAEVLLGVVHVLDCRLVDRAVIVDRPRLGLQLGLAAVRGRHAVVISLRRCLEDRQSVV